MFEPVATAPGSVTVNPTIEFTGAPIINIFNLKHKLSLPYPRSVLEVFNGAMDSQSGLASQNQEPRRTNSAAY
ncbi:MAG: hypothetical protein DMF71_16080 [Acidobacteria bacterium]|nr:MAG: hypothetical protein DMF71_16080 [Acidobacteriota bacterium]